MTTVAMLVIGDEILTGKFPEENAAYAISALRRAGLSLRRVAIIPDDVDEIAQASQALATRFDLVFTSGGVGPTHDDVTMAGVARGAGHDLELRAELFAVLTSHYGEGATAQQGLAIVPVGATLLWHPPSPWPVVTLNNIYMLPGVPALFRRGLDAVLATLQRTPVHEAFAYFRCDEASLVTVLNQLVAAFPAVKFGSYPRQHEGVCRLIISLESHDASHVAAALAQLCKHEHLLRWDPPAPAGATTPTSPT